MTVTIDRQTQQLLFISVTLRENTFFKNKKKVTSLCNKSLQLDHKCHFMTKRWTANEKQLQIDHYFFLKDKNQVKFRTSLQPDA